MTRLVTLSMEMLLCHEPEMNILIFDDYVDKYLELRSNLLT